MNVAIDRQTEPSRRTNHPGKALAWPVLVLLLAAYIPLALQTARHSDKDWTHLWLGGRMVVTGHATDLYDPTAQKDVYRQSNEQGHPPPVWAPRNDILGCFNYPPPAALAYAGIAWLPEATAAVAFAFVNIALALTAAWLLARTFGTRALLPVIAIAVLVHPAFFVNLSIGQNAVVTLTVIIGAACLFANRRDLAAGVVLGLLVFKPNWLFAVGWMPLVHGRWRAVAGICLGAGFACLSAAAALGVQSFADYFEVFRKVANLQDLPGYYLGVKYNGLSVFRRWLGMTPTADLLGWASCILMLPATWRVTRRCWTPGTTAFRHALACCWATALWINPHVNYYDMLLTAPCAVIVLLDWPALGRRQRIAAALLAALVFAAIPWDRTWSLANIAPIPSFSILALWAWSAYRLQSLRSVSIEQPTRRSVPCTAGPTLAAPQVQP